MSACAKARPYRAFCRDRPAARKSSSDAAAIAAASVSPSRLQPPPDRPRRRDRDLLPDNRPQQCREPILLAPQRQDADQRNGPRKGRLPRGKPLRPLGHAVQRMNDPTHHISSLPKYPRRRQPPFPLAPRHGQFYRYRMTNDSTARRNVLVLVAAQAVLGAQLPMIFTIAGLAGSSLAPNICWATLPITMMVIGSMLTATPISALMQRYGRRAGFFFGAASGAIGAAIGAYGLSTGSFLIFCIGALISGIYMSRKRVLPLCRRRHGLRDPSDPRRSAGSWPGAFSLPSSARNW